MKYLDDLTMKLGLWLIGCRTTPDESEIIEDLGGCLFEKRKIEAERDAAIKERDAAIKERDSATDEAVKYSGKFLDLCDTCNSATRANSELAHLLFKRMHKPKPKARKPAKPANGKKK